MSKCVNFCKKKTTTDTNIAPKRKLRKTIKQDYNKVSLSLKQLSIHLYSTAKASTNFINNITSGLLTGAEEATQFTNYETEGCPKAHHWAN